MTRVISILLAWGSIIGCGPEQGPTATETADSPATDSGVDQVALEHLQAIGYVDLDDQTDTSKSGVTVYDRERASPGFNLFTNGVDRAFLADLTGEVVHTWTAPDAKRCGTVEFLGGGQLLTIDSEAERLSLLDMDSEVIWSRNLTVHHDAARNESGDFLALIRGPVTRYKGRPTLFDGIVCLGAGGKTNWRWLCSKNYTDLKQHHPPSNLDTPPSRRLRRGVEFDYYHLNSLEVLPATPLGARDPRFRAGNLLICSRNTHLVAVLDQDTRAVTWSFGPGVLEMPHMPTMLDNGRLLIFDNGPFRKYSRVIEYDPAQEKIVWQYPAEVPGEFFSAFRGSCQRLPGGNTLICESERGRAFEVTVDGEIVWEFWNPEMVEGKRRRIYRMLRFVPDQVNGWLSR